TQNEFSACKAAERGDAVASLSEATKELKLSADGNSDKSFGEMGTCQCTNTMHKNAIITGS
ncbi:MAG: hypothetical protein K2P59_12655, partial [Acetatifactor sp.]|nr:hypothetical protein [Acetatifactor sp.]